MSKLYYFIVLLSLSRHEAAYHHTLKDMRNYFRDIRVQTWSRFGSILTPWFYLWKWKYPTISFMKQVRKEYFFVNQQFWIRYFDWVGLIFYACCFPTTYCSNSYYIIREILRTLDQSSLCWWADQISFDEIIGRYFGTWNYVKQV